METTQLIGCLEMMPLLTTLCLEEMYVDGDFRILFQALTYGEQLRPARQPSGTELRHMTLRFYGNKYLSPHAGIVDMIESRWRTTPLESVVLQGNSRWLPGEDVTMRIERLKAEGLSFTIS
jgi:hypothetical protein